MQTKTVINITTDTIDKSTPEGLLLWTAIATIGFLKFRDKKPEHILEMLKELRTNPFIEEPLSETMDKIMLKYQSKNN